MNRILVSLIGLSLVVGVGTATPPSRAAAASAGLQGKKKPPAAAKKKPAPPAKKGGPVVLGTTQLPGDFGQFGTTYTIGKSYPLNFTLKSAEYSVTPLVIGNTTYAPKNDENNGLIGGELWAYLRPLTLTGQVLLDDLDVTNATDEPGSLAFTGSLLWAGAAANVDAGFSLEAVTARAYNTHPPEGRYIYGLRGLATQFSDYVHATLFTDLYLDGLAPGLTVTPRLHALWQGSRDIRQPYPSNEEVGWILESPVERTLRAALQLRYQPDPRFWGRLEYGVNATRTGEDTQVRGVGLLTVGARLSFARPYRVSL